MTKTMDTKYIGRLAGILLAICAVTALLLGVVNYITAPIIKEHQEETKKAAMASVLTADEYTQVEVTAPNVSAFYEAVTGGAAAGYVVEATSSGFGGAMTVTVGINPDNTVSGVVVTDHAETQGVGSKVVGSSEVLAQFKGLTAGITVNGSENSFDAVSGATVSSKAVTAAVNAALDAVAAYTAG